MPYRIYILDAVGPSLDGSPFSPGWLKYFSADDHDGLGAIEVTSNPDEALEFETGHAALELWGTQSTIRPLRPDGKPNRPMTAFSVAIQEVTNETDSD